MKRINGWNSLHGAILAKSGASGKPGAVHGNDLCPGLFLHPVLAVDAGSGGIIGLVGCVALTRTQGKVTDRKKRAADGLAAAAITMAGDRESDACDPCARRPANVHLLCRSAHPRAITTGGLLPEHCARLPEQGRETITVPQRGAHKARQATVAFRFDAVSLTRPVRAHGKGQPGSILLWVVDCKKSTRPRGWSRCISAS